MKQAAVCIIENSNGQILILQRTLLPHGFCLPGGKVDPGETIVDAAIREVLEETSIVLVLTEDDKVGVVQSATNEYEVHVFYKYVGPMPNVVLSSREHIGYAWTTKPDHGFELAGNTDKMINLWSK